MMALRRWQVCRDPDPELVAAAAAAGFVTDSGLTRTWDPPWWRYVSRSHAEMVLRRERHRSPGIWYLRDRRTGERHEVGTGPMMPFLPTQFATATMAFTLGLMLVMTAALPADHWAPRLFLGLSIAMAAFVLGARLALQLERAERPPPNTRGREAGHG